jgi:transcriptional regulator of acetoin/glycerol metabolism
LTPEGSIGVEALPEAVRAHAPGTGEGGGVGTRVALDGHVPAQLQQIERSAVVAALDACGGNQTQAARRLGMSRRSLIYKMERFGLKSPPKGR